MFMYINQISRVCGYTCVSNMLLVLSQSVVNALHFYGGPETLETKNFVQTFDAFFDCLNVSNLDADRKKRKPNLRPYRSPDNE